MKLHFRVFFIKHKTATKNEDRRSKSIRFVH